MHTDDATQVLDVRDADGQPFDHIDDALAALSGSERLLLVNAFEPVPLYDVLDRRGFEYETERVAPDEWHVAIEAV
ncbi:DUF2249 domain-containing protein [Haloarchaeobius iranensis]|uniref:Uncharacterized conserved protein n=1 Tax=Haloarchaeobius iranensis TaxID=996166 RepID=A0A1G9TM95_9EURY|nr:DUF2249 domain-containing protein [Haloarchaeobius iranensis]SDM48867.1 Uncharacterized conserved protein [Haloarchaeobius iranensis]